MRKIVVTIDGPAGAGKTTVSRMLADRLGFRYIDTGALYRAIALTEQEGVRSADDAALDKLCRGLELQYVQTESGLRLLANGEDVTEKLRTPEVTMLASAVSARPLSAATYSMCSGRWDVGRGPSLKGETWERWSFQMPRSNFTWMRQRKSVP